jgi:inner membrane protein
MPTIMTHAVIAAAGGYVFQAPVKRRVRLYVLAAVTAVLPDLDVIGYHWFYIPSGHFFGHRGFFHSPFFAAVVSLVVVGVFFREWKTFSRPWWYGVVFFFLLGASHGLLDAMTNGGRGIALLSPFSNERFFLPWTPIEVSPLGVGRFLGPRGIAVIKSEAVWIWLPLAAVVVWVQAVRMAVNRNPLGTPPPPSDRGA